MLAFNWPKVYFQGNNLTKCSALFNLVIYPLEVIFVAADDGQGDYFGDLIAVDTFNHFDDFRKLRSLVLMMRRLS